MQRDQDKQGWIHQNNCKWILEPTTDPDANFAACTSNVHIQHFWLRPLLDGVVQVETDDSSMNESDIRLSEKGAHILIMTGLSRRTGQ